MYRTETCQYCNKPNSALSGTKLCDSCWEITSRMYPHALETVATTKLGREKLKEISDACLEAIRLATERSIVFFVDGEKVKEVFVRKTSCCFTTWFNPTKPCTVSRVIFKGDWDQLHCTLVWIQNTEQLTGPPLPIEKAIVKCVMNRTVLPGKLTEGFPDNGLLMHFERSL